MASFDICAIGHVTNDRITDADGNNRDAIGGAAYYTGVALGHLGLRTLVVSAAAKHDIPRFVAEFAAHSVEIQCVESRHTTAFENIYDGASGRRTQRVTAVAAPFQPSDICGVDAALFHLGPLTPADIPLECLQLLSRQNARVSLDLQGFVRDTTSCTVRVVEWPEKSEFLKHVQILKANRWEARAATGEDDPVSAARRLAALGPAEVIVTLAEKGAILFANGAIHDISAKPVSASCDPTGCGDSFCAGYLFARWQGCSPNDAAAFAAVLAAEKRKHAGPFTGGTDAIDAQVQA